MKVQLQHTAAAILLCFGSGAFAQDSGVDRIAAMVDAALPPEVGDEAYVAKLLGAKGAETPFSAVVSMAKLGSLVGDTFSSEPNCNLGGSSKEEDQTLADQVAERCVYLGEGSFLRYEMSDGKLSYINPKRVYNVKGTPNVISNEEAQKLVLELAKNLGIPSAEVRSARVRTLERMLQGSKDGKERTEIRAEVVTRIPRQVGEVPVLGSRMSATIDAKGRIATLFAQWPDFVIQPEAQAAPANSREAIADLAARRIVVTHPDTAKLAKVIATVAYVDLHRLRNSAESAGEYDDGTEKSEGAPLFVPAVVIQAIPIEPPEDGKTIALPILEIVEPLVDLAKSVDG